MDSICEPTFCTATAASPQPAIKRAITIEMLLNNILCNPIGSPIRNISFISSLCICERICTCKKISVSFLIAMRNNRQTIIWAITVAIAAPRTPIAGIPPKPKIKIGSKRIFMSNPKAVTIKEVLEFPMAVKIPVNI